VFDKVSRSAESQGIIDSARFEATNGRNSRRVMPADEHDGKTIVQFPKAGLVF
jgi:hypothetical protein